MVTPFNDVEFDSSNPEPRCPCILLLDVSASMSGAPIAQLNDGLKTFKEELMKDKLAALRVEVAVITFGPTAVKQDFVSAGAFEPPTLAATGDTPMGEAINLALDKLQERKQVYKTNGIDYFRPWIFLITDGSPTDGEAFKGAAARAQQMETEQKLAFFAVGVEGADMKTLAQITPRAPLKLKGMSFREMFMWLSASLTSVSHSRVGEEVRLAPPTGWGAA